jgi:hypothetical protein
MAEGDPERQAEEGGGAAGPPAPPPSPVEIKPLPAGLGLATSLALAGLGLATILTVIRVATAPQSGAIPLSPTPEGPLPGDPVARDPSPPEGPAAPFGMNLTMPSARTPSHLHGEAGVASSSATRNPSGVAEVRLLTAAQEVLDREPGKALAMCDEHARRFPTGVLIEERELLAMQALMALNRAEDAKKRAAAFKAAFPDSPLEHRVDQIMNRTPGAPAP